MPARLSAAHVLIIAAAVLTLAASRLALQKLAGPPETTREPKAVSMFGERLERQIEKLQDAQWLLSEDEARLRDLLDAQADMILRRDTQGRLTFANTAFCTAFGVELAAVLGSQFKPVCIDSEPVIAGAGTLSNGRIRSYELVETVKGKRWICWETSPLRVTGKLAETQISGRDVTDERAADAALMEARDQAQAANRAKSRFLAAMSHEIRTPMNGILGMAGLLRETPLAPDQETYVAAIDQSARNLLALINEILDFSKIEAGKLVLAQEPFALMETVQGAVELMAPIAEEKGLEIAWTVEPACRGLFTGDKARLRQILLNLLSNAIKFTDLGGVSVAVTAGKPANNPADQAFEISVRDSGIGLTSTDLATIFTEFEQADAAITRQRGGTGLGLAISMQLAHAMKGSIRVVSTVGQGSTFALAIELPRASRERVRSALGLKAERPMAVLLACDRVLERQAMATHLKEARIAVTVAPLHEARAALNANTSGSARTITRVIVEGDGDPILAGQLLKQAKALAHPAEVKGLVLISPIARDGLAAFRHEGFTGYLVRPVRPNSFLAQLRDASGSAPEVRGRSNDGESLDDISAVTVPRVLLAEDNAVNRLLATRIIERAGCAVVPAANGLEAVALVRQTIAGDVPAFALILMDMRMPHLDGLAACTLIRSLFEKSPGLQRPPIVAITANAFAEDRARCLENGMDDYLAKPFDVEDLQALLAKWGCAPLA